MTDSLAEQGYGKVKGELEEIAAKRAKQVTEADLDKAQLALGAVGIADPTGAADAANAGISLARGDYFGFVLDGISAIPYAGDAVAKPIRGVQMGIRSWARGSRVAGLAKRGADLVQTAEQMRRKAADAAKAARKALCTRCNNAYGSMVPKKGTWANADDIGHGTYTATTGKKYQFKEGYPDFENKEMHQYLYPDGKNAVSIEMTGTRRIDDQLANAAAGLDKKPNGYTWHHGDDGTTMYLVKDNAHKDLIPHDGGHSIAKDKVF